MRIINSLPNDKNNRNEKNIVSSSNNLKVNKGVDKHKLWLFFGVGLALLLII